MKILGIIPARGRSKRVPRKNIRPLLSEPLIAWTIKSSLDVSLIDKLICSTDDMEIAEIARSYGCEVPFIRPKGLGADHVRVVDVILNSIEFMEKNKEYYDIVVTLQCTSPLRRSEDIEKALEYFISKKIKSLISVCEMQYPPYWTFTMSAANELKAVFGFEKAKFRSQELPKTYRSNGAIFINQVKSLKFYKDFLKPKPFGFIMNPLRSVDIDSIDDFAYIEYLIRSKKVFIR